MDPISWLRHPTRSRILAAAERLFAERGFDATSIDDLLVAAGVSRSHLYYHFPSKHAVLAGLVRLRAADLAESTQPWPAILASRRDLLRILLVERVLRPGLVEDCWLTARRLVPAGLDADGEIVRAACGTASG